MRAPSLALFASLSLLPAVAWADISPPMPVVLARKALSPEVGIPALILFALGVGMVVYVKKKRAPDQTSAEQE